MAEVESRSRPRRTESNWAAICFCSAFSCLHLSWERLVLRKWLNVPSAESDFSADSDSDDDEIATGFFFLSSKLVFSGSKLRRRNSETFRKQYMDTEKIRICAGTWNVGGQVPPADLDIDGWLDTVEPADIYVLGLQEIVPLNAGNIFGIEDDQPASEWENIIREALNRVRPRNLKILSHSDPPSPPKFNSSKEISYSVKDMLVKTNHDACDAVSSMDKKPNSERVSYTERVGLSWPETPLSLLNRYVMERRGSIKSVNQDIMNLRKPSYVRIVSKQMVGVFITIWVRRSLRKHISNISVSTVGVGIMGYIGNKGSVSVSMAIYQTPFCFLCTHLSSGEKDTDHQKRNDDVREIHRRTQFHPDSLNTDGVPRSIRDHERIIWLGDLNYRINLSYEETHELIARKEWQRLVENDQLSVEMSKGNVFEGWSEGTIDFPPTYKYEINSENYIGDEPESGKRKPAWCDRIIWNGKEMKLLNYRRNEIKLSDHRPVTATFLAEVEVLSPRKLQRALALANCEIKGHYEDLADA
ncbi:unnamed protein product [Cochlearia groenlandica]